MLKKRTTLEKIVSFNRLKLPNIDENENAREMLDRAFELSKTLGLRKIAQRITEKTGVKCSKDTVARWLKNRIT